MAGRLLKAAAIFWLFGLLIITAMPMTSAQGGSSYGVYIQDEAGIISTPMKNELYNRAVWIHQHTGTAQVGIVTVKSLGNQTLEDYAVSRFRKMGLGSKERNDGVLLLYSASDKHVRIEVGYGLEGRIPDGKAGTILDRYFVPNRDEGNLDLAFSQTQSAIVKEIAAEFGVDTTGIVDEGLPPLADGGAGGFFSNMPGYVKILLGLGVVLLIFLDFKLTGGVITFAIINSLGRRGGSGGGGGGRGGGGSSGGGGASR
ncbi:TPM domain-containing protein [Cohnella abietis]|uniref:TPM domain-containing protein n=1 Tax=Cohnella abietis TaxID=2507935 RepID=A0A3T1D0P2_9BACL|nr:TPM domain-containing protein [Cohnella abietis]BBI31677.1 hypothetical protein KCTCHS21_10760 [Cohnella abietis]